MAAFTKFNAFVAELANGSHNLGTATIKAFLSNSAPLTATHTAYDATTGVTGPAEIAAGNGYTAGGVTCTVTSSTQSSGLYKLVLADPAAIVAAGGSIGPFRYIVLYDTSASNKLMGYWDYGTAVQLLDTESFQIDFDGTNGVFTLS